MKQIVHIFAKDTRHLWLEILLSLSLLAALVLTSHGHFLFGTHYYGGYTVSFSPQASLGLLPSLLTLLIPLSWWILISPVIHEERLVGDRQFWLTRPYEWKNLLAAKVLFILVYLYLPLFLAQCGVLARAGFNPFRFLPGLLYDLFLITTFVILPLVALATVTRNFGRMTLAILGVGVSLIAAGALVSVFPGNEIATPFLGWVSLVLVICGCVIVITLQYAARKTVASWTVLGMTLAVVAALACAAPDQALMNRRYSAQQGSRIEVAYFNEAGAAPVASVARGPSDVVINVPIQVSGVTPGSMIIPRALKATLEAPDGTHWTSFWQPIDTDRLLLAAIGTGAPTTVRSLRAPFSVPRSLYEKVKAMPLRLHVVLAIERARQGSTTTVTLPLNDFQVPLVGICTPQTNYYKPGEIGGIACRAALRPPRLTFVRISWSYDDCHKPGEERHNVDGEAWVGSLEQPPAEFAIAPIWADLIAFSNRQPDYRIDQPRHICPGTPAIFTTYEAAGRTQAALDISGFVLPELSQGQMTVIAKP